MFSSRTSHFFCQCIFTVDNYSLCTINSFGSILFTLLFLQYMPLYVVRYICTVCCLKQGMRYTSSVKNTTQTAHAQWYEGTPQRGSFPPAHAQPAISGVLWGPSWSPSGVVFRPSPFKLLTWAVYTAFLYDEFIVYEVWERRAANVK
jgi:hypothetical protein